jgi:hypothetical protein
MIKMIAAACRKPGMTHGEYIGYVLGGSEKTIDESD